MKLGYLVIFALRMASQAYAQEDIVIYRTSIGAMVGANLMDLASSLNAPGHETNPLIGNANGKMVA